ncbi:MAG TPA: hypothetical protein DCZ91_22315 [Lachnospiraceae bacterium]|nr:hypothetical protein [Lachnospiraceae bacterium]
MKKKLCFGILLFIVVLATAAYIDSYNFRQSMNDVSIVHYIAGSGSGYSTVYLTAIVPADSYCGENTLEAIQRYVLRRNREIPDTLRITLYDSMEKLREGDSYFEITLRK